MKRSNNLICEIGSSVMFIAALVPELSAAAEGPKAPYEMVAITNQAFGSLVVNGDHQEAIRLIPEKDRTNPFSAATNLCVVHTALGQYEAALPFCDRAIEVAEWSSRPPKPRRWKGREQVATLAALAFSNRGVLRVLLGDKDGAANDFNTAIEFKDEMRAPLNNFARLNMDANESVAVTINSH